MRVHSHGPVAIDLASVSERLLLSKSDWNPELPEILAYIIQLRSVLNRIIILGPMDKSKRHPIGVFRPVSGSMDIAHLIPTFMQNAELFKLVLSTLPESKRVGLLADVGIALLDRFEQTGSMEDLNRAIVINEQAVESTPDDHADRARMLNNLGIALQSRFEQTGSINDLGCAVITNEQAVESTPDRHLALLKS